MKPTLYIFSGLPGAGKTTVAKALSQKTGAACFRLDTIEQGIADLCNFNVQGEGYRLAYRIIKDNLQIGNNVVVDSCNPIKLTRNEYENVAKECNCNFINIEIICSNPAEHKKRVETRKPDIDSLKLPAWEDVLKRRYDAWDKDHIVIDTYNKDIEHCIKELMEKIDVDKNEKTNGI